MNVTVEYDPAKEIHDGTNVCTQTACKYLNAVFYLL